MESQGPKLCIRVRTAAEVERKLNAAEAKLQRQASEERIRGILAVKVGPGRYELEFSKRVPYGITWELNERNDPGTCTQQLINRRRRCAALAGKLPRSRRKPNERERLPPTTCIHPDMSKHLAKATTTDSPRNICATNTGTKRAPRKWKKHRMTDPEEHHGRDDLE
jgi:hypothetical protein